MGRCLVVGALATRPKSQRPIRTTGQDLRLAPVVSHNSANANFIERLDNRRLALVALRKRLTNVRFAPFSSNNFFCFLDTTQSCVLFQLYIIKAFAALLNVTSSGEKLFIVPAVA
jgi:hypothetical protein